MLEFLKLLYFKQLRVTGYTPERHTSTNIRVVVAMAKFCCKLFLQLLRTQ